MLVLSLLCMPTASVCGAGAGTGTAGTLTFCLSDPGTIMPFSSGTRLGPGSKIKCNTKVKNPKLEANFQGKMLPEPEPVLEPEPKLFQSRSRNGIAINHYGSTTLPTAFLFTTGTGKGCFSDIEALSMFPDYRYDLFWWSVNNTYQV
jgi:hypothetical protein